MSLVADLRPLRRHRDLRLLLAGRFVSDLGSMLTFVAVPYQVYRLTHSSLAVGLIGIADLVPILLVAFLGGALADAFDRRRLVQIAEAGAGACSLILVVNAMSAHSVIVIFAAASAAAAFYAVLRPSLDAMVPRLVDTDELVAASVLSTFTGSLARLGGPALAGVLIATSGLAVTYGLDAVSFAVSFAFLAMMGRMPPPRDADRPSLRRVWEGLRFAASRPELVGTYSVDGVAMLFGMPEALFPAFAARWGGATALGFLYAAQSAGGILATITAGWTRYPRRHGLCVILAACGWGVGVIIFGAAHSLVLALIGLAAAGAADTISGIFRSTIWNQTIPDHLRGRLASIELVSYTSGPLLGDVEAGVVASLAGIRFSAISGGVLCVVGVAITAAALPAFRRYQAPAGPAAASDASGSAS